MSGDAVDEIRRLKASDGLDGFIAAPDDGAEFPKGKDNIEHVFGWRSHLGEDSGANKDEVDRVYPSVATGMS